MEPTKQDYADAESICQAIDYDDIDDYSGRVRTIYDDSAKKMAEIRERISAARDAEWQARVDAFLEDNNRSEEQVKKQFANAVSFKARAEKAEARVDRLEAALKTVQPYFCDPDFHEEYLKRWPMKNRCPTCGLFVADWDAIRAALGRIA